MTHRNPTPTKRTVFIVTTALLLLSALGIAGVAGTAAAQSANATDAPEYNLEFDEGGTYAFGSPGKTGQTMTDVFDEDMEGFDGSVYAFDESEQRWNRVSDVSDIEVEALDAYVVVVEEGESASATIQFEQTEQSNFPQRNLIDGFNFVTASQNAEAFDQNNETGGNAGFSTTSDVNSVQNPFNPPTASPGTEDDFDRATESGDGRVDPFAGYFLFSGSGTIESLAQTDANQSAVNNDLNVEQLRTNISHSIELGSSPAAALADDEEVTVEINSTNREGESVTTTATLNGSNPSVDAVTEDALFGAYETDVSINAADVAEPGDYRAEGSAQEFDVEETGGVSGPAFTLRFNSTVSGEVINDTGDGVADATVNITNASSGEAVRTITTNSTTDPGAYETTLPSGTYNVTVDKSGFAEITNSSITVTPGESKVVDFDLQPATINGAVELEAAAPAPQPANGLEVDIRLENDSGTQVATETVTIFNSGDSASYSFDVDPANFSGAGGNSAVFADINRDNVSNDEDYSLNTSGIGDDTEAGRELDALAATDVQTENFTVFNAASDLSVTARNATADGSTANVTFNGTLNKDVSATVSLNVSENNLTASNISSVTTTTAGANSPALTPTDLLRGDNEINTTSSGEFAFAVEFASGVVATEEFEAELVDSQRRVSEDANATDTFDVDTTVVGADGFESVTAPSVLGDAPVTENYTVTLDESVQANVTLDLDMNEFSANNISNVEVNTGTPETTVNNTTLFNGTAVVKTNQSGKLDVAVTFGEDILKTGDNARFITSINSSDPNITTSKEKDTGIFKIDTVAADAIAEVTAPDATATNAQATQNHTVTLDEAVSANVTVGLVGGNLTAADIVSVSAFNGTEQAGLTPTGLVNRNAVVNTSSQGEIDLGVTFDSSVDKTDVFNASIDASDSNVDVSDSNETAFNVDTTEEATATVNGTVDIEDTAPDPVDGLEVRIDIQNDNATEVGSQTVTLSSNTSTANYSFDVDPANFSGPSGDSAVLADINRDNVSNDDDYELDMSGGIGDETEAGRALSELNASETQTQNFTVREATADTATINGTVDIEDAAAAPTNGSLEVLVGITNDTNGFVDSQTVTLSSNTSSSPYSFTVDPAEFSGSNNNATVYADINSSSVDNDDSYTLDSSGQVEEHSVGELNASETQTENFTVLAAASDLSVTARNATADGSNATVEFNGTLNEEVSALVELNISQNNLTTADIARVTNTTGDGPLSASGLLDGTNEIKTTQTGAFAFEIEFNSSVVANEAVEAKVVDDYNTRISENANATDTFTVNTSASAGGASGPDIQHAKSAFSYGTNVNFSEENIVVTPAASLPITFGSDSDYELRITNTTGKTMTLKPESGQPTIDADELYIGIYDADGTIESFPSVQAVNETRDEFEFIDVAVTGNTSMFAAGVPADPANDTADPFGNYTVSLIDNSSGTQQTVSSTDPRTIGVGYNIRDGITQNSTTGTIKFTVPRGSANTGFNESWYAQFTIGFGDVFGPVEVPNTANSGNFTFTVDSSTVPAGTYDYDLGLYRSNDTSVERNRIVNIGENDTVEIQDESTGTATVNGTVELATNTSTPAGGDLQANVTLYDDGENVAGTEQINLSTPGSKTTYSLEVDPKNFSEANQDSFNPEGDIRVEIDETSVSNGDRYSQPETFVGNLSASTTETVNLTVLPKTTDLSVTAQDVNADGSNTTVIFSGSANENVSVLALLNLTEGNLNTSDIRSVTETTGDVTVPVDDMFDGEAGVTANSSGEFVLEIDFASGVNATETLKAKMRSTYNPEQVAGATATDEFSVDTTAGGASDPDIQHADSTARGTGGPGSFVAEDIVIEPAAADSITFGPDTEYELTISNSTGETVTLTPEAGEQTTDADALTTHLYNGDGTILSNPTVIANNDTQGNNVEINVTVSGNTSMFAAGVPTDPANDTADPFGNYTVSLVDNSTGTQQAVSSTSARTMGIGYNIRDGITQNSTTGAIQFTVPRRVANTGFNESWYAQFSIGNNDEFGPVEVDNTASSDYFTFTVDSSTAPAGNYTYRLELYRNQDTTNFSNRIISIYEVDAVEITSVETTAPAIFAPEDSTYDPNSEHTIGTDHNATGVIDSSDVAVRLVNTTASNNTEVALNDSSTVPVEGDVNTTIPAEELAGNVSIQTQLYNTSSATAVANDTVNLTAIQSDVGASAPFIAETEDDIYNPTVEFNLTTFHNATGVISDGDVGIELMNRTDGNNTVFASNKSDSVPVRGEVNTTIPADALSGDVTIDQRLVNTSSGDLKANTTLNLTAEQSGGSTATVNGTVDIEETAAEPTDDLEVRIDVQDDSGTEVGSQTVTLATNTSTAQYSFDVNPTNFNGTSGEAAVSADINRGSVSNDEDYSLQTTTVEVNELNASEVQSENFSVLAAASDASVTAANATANGSLASTTLSGDLNENVSEVVELKITTGNGTLAGNITDVSTTTGTNESNVTASGLTAGTTEVKTNTTGSFDVNVEIAENVTATEEFRVTLNDEAERISETTTVTDRFTVDTEPNS